MKKLQVLLIAICVLLALASCGAQTVNVTGDDETTPDDHTSGPYALDVLGKSYEELVSAFGLPLEQNTGGATTEMVFADFHAYVMEGIGVIQVDKLNGMDLAIGFPAKLTYRELCDACIAAGLPTPSFVSVPDSRYGLKNVCRAKVNAGGYVMSYTWESDDDSVDLKNEKCTTAVLHFPDYYLWD